MKKTKYSINPLKALIFSASLFSYAVCFNYARPPNPTDDAVSRFWAAQNFSFDNIYFVLLSEPFALIIASITQSPYEFLLLYSALASVIACFLLRIPLWAFGLFVFLPQGYLLTFNITPSLIAFSVVNYCLLIKFRSSFILLGLANHLVAVLSLIGALLRSWQRSHLNKLLLSILVILTVIPLSGFLNSKMLAYSGAEGNMYHIYLAIGFLLVIFTCGIHSFRLVSLMYMILVLAALLFSVKMSSRLAFGADLLMLQFCVFSCRAKLSRMFPRQPNR